MNDPFSSLQLIPARKAILGTVRVDLLVFIEHYLSQYVKMCKF